ncbi:MAG: hypothetical protein KAS40_05605, partial [Desulfobacterales bacterium]|nr:hypothetical protein [Desulfobacterales bacterium]
SIYVDFGTRVRRHLLEMEGSCNRDIFNRFGLRQFQMFYGIACRQFERVKNIETEIFIDLLIGF